MLRQRPQVGVLFRTRVEKPIDVLVRCRLLQSLGTGEEREHCLIVEGIEVGSEPASNLRGRTPHPNLSLWPVAQARLDFASSPFVELVAELLEHEHRVCHARDRESLVLIGSLQDRRRLCLKLRP